MTLLQHGTTIAFTAASEEPKISGTRPFAVSQGALMKTIRPIDRVLALPAAALFSIAMTDYLEERLAFLAIAVGTCVCSETLLATIYLISKKYGTVLAITSAAAEHIES
jgi:hypothetical protein